MDDFITNGKSDIQMPPNEQDEIMKKMKIELKNEIRKFLSSNTVYESIPENMKILVFNNELSIKDTIEAMIKEDIYCGLIWNTETNRFIGIFTIRDFLNLIKILYEKLNFHVKSNGKLSNLNSIASIIFPGNKIDLEKLDEIIEKAEYSMYNSEISEKSDSDMIIDSDLEFSIEKSMKTYKEFFKIFKNININDYLTNASAVCLINYI